MLTSCHELPAVEYQTANAAGIAAAFTSGGFGQTINYRVNAKRQKTQSILVYYLTREQTQSCAYGQACNMICRAIIQTASLLGKHWCETH